MAAPGRGEQGDVGAGKIGERVGLEVAPQVLDRIQLRSVGREVKLPPLHHVKENLKRKPAMNVGTIPNQEQRTAKVTSKLL